MPQIASRDDDGVRVFTLDNPPVNALSFAFSAMLLRSIRAAEEDDTVQAVVITGSNGIFSGGADVNDFNAEMTPKTITIRDVIAAIEASAKTYVAAIEGTALGGALELALACDYRLACHTAKIGLPEIKLGLIPGAGGTQRLPRVIGAQPALELMLNGSSIKAEEAQKRGLVDEVVADGVVTAAIAAAREAAKSEPKRRVSERHVKIGGGPSTSLRTSFGAVALPFVVAQAHKMLPSEEQGGFAAHKLVDSLQASVELPFPRGLAREARLFAQCARSPQSSALRHLFFAERELAKIPDLRQAEPLEIKSAGVLGAGTMGTGIAIAFANAGIPVTVVEPADGQVERAKQTVFGMFMHQVQRGRLTQEEAWNKGRSIVFTVDRGALRDCDLVIEAVFENMHVKQQVFAELDTIVQPNAILATNTSTLDIDAMAAVVSRPERFVGLHFFAPANIMKLLEIIRGRNTSAQTLATAVKLSKTLRKVGVLSANAFGFIGNRMLFDYAREAVRLAEEGVSPHRVDAVIKDFGFAMGPFAMFDLSGIDVFRHVQQAAGQQLGRTAIIDRLHEEERLGLKAGRGFYKYAQGSREPKRDEEVERLFADEAKRFGLSPREPGDEEIVKRLVYALINRGAELLREGVALRPGDIDIVYIYGYGFPPYHGGPMWYADEVGVRDVYDDVVRFADAFGAQWTPSPLLAEIASSGGRFSAFNARSPELINA
ncbi:MAG: enoyl-CoA hydratase/isomerase family protein [Candidatus Eremiobacteraeota bacterium]|nr:enoyl-CoA hydratase/isomerase family protein [Candidatus Eremiobacteraeota bacterium]